MAVKLYYFDGRGLAEPTRLILSYAGVEFEEIRVPVGPAGLPQEVKDKCRWGQVPLVEFDGKTLVQSLAVARYFARKHKLVPEDPYEAALCDEYIDSVKEIHSAWYTISQEPEEKKADKRQEVLKATKAKFFDKFEALVKANGGKNLVGNAVTWADIYLFNTINQIDLVHGIKVEDEYPSLKAVIENVLGNPGIKAWVDKRPESAW